MCDCYGHTCDADGCSAVIPMHLEDFATDRDEVAVYCEAHAGPGCDGVIWLWNDDDEFDDVPAEQIPAEHWHRCRVVPLTANARAHAGGNMPNTWHVRRAGEREEHEG